MNKRIQKILNISPELLKVYKEYSSSLKSLAILFVKKELNQAKSCWIDIVDFESYDSTCVESLEFRSVICGLYKKKLKPVYPPKSKFIFNGKFNEYDYVTTMRYITWETAHRDIEKQKKSGVLCRKYEICGVKYNKNRNKFIKKPPHLDDAMLKNINIYELTRADRAYLRQFMMPEDWHYKITSIKRLS